MTSSSWTFEQDGLSISVQRSKDTAVVLWRGVSDARNPGAFLKPVIERLSSNVQGVKVTVDFRLLEYINSATVAPLVQLVKRLDAAGSSVRVVYSDVDWQRVQMNCMKSIARTLSNVRVECRPGSSADAADVAAGAGSGSA